MFVDISIVPFFSVRMEMLISIIFAAVYGLIFGSFANAVAYRVPTGETLWSRSHCPKCDAKITWWMNIPVLSWVFLRGKCYNCKNPISIQYPAIELLTSALFVVTAISVYNLHLDLIPGVIVGVVFCYFVFIGVVLSIIDFKTMKLPTKLIYPTMIFGFIGLTIAALMIGDPMKIVWMLVGSLISGGYYFVLWFIAPRHTGFGDVRLNFLVGLLLGWLSLWYVIIAVILAYVAVAIVYLPLILLKVVDRKAHVPMGPWIILGAILSLVFGDIIVNTYLSLGGLS